MRCPCYRILATKRYQNVEILVYNNINHQRTQKSRQHFVASLDANITCPTLLQRRCAQNDRSPASVHSHDAHAKHGLIISHDGSTYLIHSLGHTVSCNSFGQHLRGPRSAAALAGPRSSCSEPTRHSKLSSLVTCSCTYHLQAHMQPTLSIHIIIMPSQ